jgi:SsrA-binding protein
MLARRRQAVARKSLDPRAVWKIPHALSMDAFQCLQVCRGRVENVDQQHSPGIERPMGGSERRPLLFLRREMSERAEGHDHDAEWPAVDRGGLRHVGSHIASGAASLARAIEHGARHVGARDVEAGFGDRARDAARAAGDLQNRIACRFNVLQVESDIFLVSIVLEVVKCCDSGIRIGNAVWHDDSGLSPVLRNVAKADCTVETMAKKSKAPENPNERVIATNRRAFHDYEILDSVEAGIALTGSEIKSIRAGKISLAEAYARIDDGELWLIGSHIAPYSHGAYANHDPTRPRKLLVHRGEIVDLRRQVEAKGMTLVPLRVAIRRGKAKIDVGVARAKKLYDKRATEAERQSRRDIQRSLVDRT